MRWIDGTPLLPHIEPYRMKIFVRFNDVDQFGHPRVSLGVYGRSKKNWKTADAMLESLLAVLSDSPGGSQVYIACNDEDQAGDDLTLVKKLIKANPQLEDWL